jgi:hypothetical protein
MFFEFHFAWSLWPGGFVARAEKRRASKAHPHFRIGLTVLGRRRGGGDQIDSAFIET